MSTEILKNEVRKYENQIDLVDLIKILLKNKGLILLTAAIITLMSVGGAFYIKANKIEKFGQNFKLIDFNDSYYNKKADLTIKKFIIEDILLKNEVVDEFYKNEEFNKYSQTKNKDKILNEDEKREFINNSIKINKVMDEGKKEIKYYSLISNIKANKGLSEKLIALYIDIINKEKAAIIINAIDTEDDFIIQKRNLYEKKVKEGEKNIAEIIKQQPVSILENQEIISMLSITNPSLLQEMDSDKALYEKYYDQAVGIEGLKEDKNLNQQIEKLSSIYKVEEKSKSMMIVAMGLILGLFLGIFAAFMKEFFENVDFKN
ncbi:MULTISPECIES: hypothetical protein [Psychrilyobacter]|uniref:Polysaccharide chain length determinant N-terminal domain-containing protein n=1 Tax=Psychrilyobacter piezotolerans TaxID=2293438 RepID=A0ABX9KKX9_9FUSO|nr:MULTISPECIES: hypothetical protein [Psychrilyobacter]MCS5420423.1 hypothetical protein [Psychrilyobacter sp. S5]NDI76433.1 hypothetical protein [Psychrilyobacter piezotolerans]RDE66029.1 hypothetical protein DV867_00705 [Psychrilyobacter sp. S5]REI43207.1 hypothetical protein DYH56_00705 [Psychrilyobacter piezotolerans]